MISKKHTFLLLSFTLFALKAMGQGYKKPSFLILFNDFNTYLNASNFEGNELYLGNQNRLGAFSEIREFYLISSFSIAKKNDQGIGFSLYSGQEGQLIAENRLKVSYRKSLVLKDNLSLSFGGQIGFINTSLKATLSTAGANTWSPDIDFGLSLKSNKLTLGASINQIGNLDAQPLRQKIIFKQFYTLSGKYEIKLNDKIILNNYLNLYVFTSVLFNYLSEIEINKAFSVGLGYGNNGLIFSTSYQTDRIINKMTEISIGYQNPTLSSLPNTYQSIQLQLSTSF